MDDKLFRLCLVFASGHDTAGAEWEQITVAKFGPGVTELPAKSRDESIQVLIGVK